ncbi:MAG: SDR family oxidoreductase [Bacteroidetes bacterium]|nr:SDR family oxidoreductase [Bacteroidota bacterium]
MKILLTGANGFLGQYLCAMLLAEQHEVIATGKGPCRLPFQQSSFQYHTLDFTSAEQVQTVLDQYEPDIIVHAGAMTQPDQCEQEPEKAYRVNVEGTRHLLSCAVKRAIYFIYISTDFIFDGKQGMYDENAIPGPVNFYGKTKLQAESLVNQYPFDWTIVRTVLVYGKPLAGRNNILTVVKQKLENGEKYRVVSDQVRTPTYVEDLAAGIVKIIEQRAGGLFHISGADILTPFDMAIKTAHFLGLNASLLVNVNADTFSQPAIRPLKTGFNITKARMQLDYQPHSFEEGLRKTFS